MAQLPSQVLPASPQYMLMIAALCAGKMAATYQHEAQACFW